MYDAVIRSKLTYGLEAVQVNDSLNKKTDAFQLKGLRQILGLQTTYVNRANTNEHVFSTANRIINEWEMRRREGGEGFRPCKHIMRLTCPPLRLKICWTRPSKNTFKKTLLN